MIGYYERQEKHPPVRPGQQEDFMKNPIFKGIGTALITPMTEAGQIDYAAMERLVA